MKKMFIITCILILCFSGMVLAVGNKSKIEQKGDQQIARVGQEGIVNEVFIIQGLGCAESNEAYVYQNGDNNIANVEQYLDKNIVDISQEGDYNTVDIIQTGSNNECTLEQINDNNKFECFQIGSGNLIKGLDGDSYFTLEFNEDKPAVQFDGATFTSTQVGWDNKIGLYQGNGYSAHIEQYSGNKKALLYQTGGPDHYVEIIQYGAYPWFGDPSLCIKVFK